MHAGSIDFHGKPGEERRAFVRDVASRTPLPPQVTSEVATAAVMCAITERLTRGGVHLLVHALPEPIRELFRACGEHRSNPPTPLHRPELLDRIAEHLGVTPAHAEGIARAVLSAVRERLPANVDNKVAAQLPRDIKNLWYAAPTTNPSMPLPDDDLERLSAAILTSIQAQASLPADVEPEEAFAGVMCIFSRRLSGGEARHVTLGLPSTIRALLTPCILHRRESAEVFSAEEFLQHVADHLDISPWDAERVVRAVFHAVTQVLPERDVHDAASQLPTDLRALWLSTLH
jgi:uncharacterized protein (DUF2267 family)